MTDPLFTPFDLGALRLPNRAVMAPMTRSRALGNVPNELMATYYAQRAGAGLIVSEATAPSPNALGYPRIPGLFSPEQVAGWRQVTHAVHEAGGRIFAQLMHVGRIAHPANLPEGAEVLAPSAIAAKGEMYTDAEGLQPFPTPRAMTLSEVEEAREEFVRAAILALESGFDGVELHGANGYLIDQFLHPGTNTREDAYGGWPEHRNRFALEVAQAVADAIGPERLGIRLSPYGVFNDIQPFDGIEAQFTELARGLGKLRLAYLHLVDHSAMGAPPVPEDFKQALRRAFGGTVVLSGGYDAARAKADLSEGKGELIAFGRPFLANPDLLERYQQGAELNEPKADLFYTPGAEGYTDYPTLA
ncbi:MAG: alkene reductase [Planctomycetota bacterium]